MRLLSHFSNTLLNSYNYLPKDSSINKNWFDVSPYMHTKTIKDKGLILSPYYYSINTVGSTQKIATHDIRGTVPCPKINCCPWNNSSVDPDINIVGLGCNNI